MTWERVQAMCAKRGAKLNAKRIWPQQYGTSNGFGIAARWEDGRKSSAMVSRLHPDSMTDEQLGEAISAAVEKLAV